MKSGISARRARRRSAYCCRPCPSCLPRYRSAERSADIALGVAAPRSPAPSKADESFVFLPFCNAYALVYFRDIVGNGQRAIGAEPLACWPVRGCARGSVGQLLKQNEVLHQHWARGPCRDAFLVVENRYAAVGIRVDVCLKYSCSRVIEIPATRRPLQCHVRNCLFRRSPVDRRAFRNPGVAEM